MKRSTLISIIAFCLIILIAIPGEKASASPLVTNVFYDTDLREALRDISAQTGVNIIPDETVQGVVTLEAVDMPLEECLSRMLTPLGYTFKKVRDYYVVGAPHPQNPAFPLLTETTLYTPNYLKADDIYRLLSDYYAPYVKLNAFTNSLAITASSEMTRDILEKISKIDVPPKQVMIEAIVTEMSESAARSLGIDWSFSGTDLDRSTFSVSTKSTSPSDSIFSVSLRKLRRKWGDFNVDVMTSIKALEDAGEVEIRANPRLATLNGQSASIFIGREEYYSIVTGPISYPYTKLELIQVGISLNVTPYVSEDGQITVDIKPEVSDVTGKGATELPVVSKRSVSTRVRVKDGETITVGGLRLKTERTRKAGIPFLCRIPILGYLFGHDVHYTEDTEVVVFITPRIIEE